MIIALALAATVAAQPAAAVEQSPQDKIEALQQVYDESCGSRGYGEYDDVCNSITNQIHEAEREFRKQMSRPKRAAAPSLPAATAPVAAPPTIATPK